MTDLILASGSPRRRELFTLAGLSFTVETAKVEESYDRAWSPEQVVRHLARIKARAVFEKHPGATVVGADTIVALSGEILGKPKDREDAVRMLTELSGKTHEVFTGVCIIGGTREKCFFERTKVRFYDLTPEEIESYVGTGEPLDKAGAYGIQGKGVLLVKRISGDYSNVVGLPLARTVRELKKFSAF